MRLAWSLLGLGLGFAAGGVACSVADIPGGPGGGEPNVVAKPASAAGGPSVCGGPPATLEPGDPAKLPACECKSGGKARCVGIARMPEALSNQLEKCDEDKGACVPDSVVASGYHDLPACKAKGKDGRCLGLCVPLVAKYAETFLTRGDGDVCPADERCVPCENPLDGLATGVCEFDPSAPVPAEVCDGADAGSAPRGVALAPGETPPTCPFSGTPVDVSRFPACGAGGRCLDPSLVADPRLKGRLPACSGGVCVPEIYVAEKGLHLPAACTSFFGIEGRCFSTVFEDIHAQKDVLPRDACEPNDRCVPCFNPATGKPTGACETVPCDHARTSGSNLQDCCRLGGSMRGKCISRGDVPDDIRSRLDDRECDDSELCVPKDNIDPTIKPVTCAATGGRGICVSNCVEMGFFESLLLDRGSCRSDQTCVPCRNPATGAALGLPGCG